MSNKFSLKLGAFATFNIFSFELCAPLLNMPQRMIVNGVLKK
ncbi:hypothetical protein [uncultured Gammaproteobacteria bacterium]|nr:hypothetical protein [uncultured Gammaproteobacteria bacterium]SMN14261.1 hypothetical protein CRYPD_592 [uncultured Candidatus Thioglobus sp.]